jgi:adenylate cyclase
MVDLVGLDQGMVLLGQDGQVEVAACHTASDKIAASYSRTLVKKVMREGRTFFENVAAMALEAESLRSIAVALVSPIFGLRDEVIGVLYGTRVWRGTGPITIRPIDAHVVQLLAATIGAHLTRTAALRTRFQFEQFFSAELVRELERNPDLLEGREQEVTILVSDLRDSTQIVERADAVTSCRLVRDVMERLTDCIAAEGGVVVDYAGDGILAMWNAPVEQPDHPERACRAALAMLAEVPALNQHWQAVIGQPLRLGIGINTGTARVGNTGSSHKVKYGPHGRTVNLASRIEGVTKRLGLSLLITDTTQARLPASWPAKRLGRFELRGIAEEVVLYELAEEDSSSQPEQQPDGNSAESRG